MKVRRMASLTGELRDPALVARVRALLRAEHAGYREEDNGRRGVCLEPGCTCGGGVCGPFRSPAIRCSTFEELVLPLDPALEVAYRGYLRSGARMRLRRCRWHGCRHAVSAPNARWCERHAALARRRAKAEYARRHRAARVLAASNKWAPPDLDQQAPREGSSDGTAPTPGDIRTCSTGRSQ